MSVSLWRKLETPPPSHWRRLVAQRQTVTGVNASGCVIAVLAVVSLGMVALLAGTLWAVIMARRTSSVIGRMRDGGAFDMLAVTPPGTAAVCWQIAGAALHYVVTMDDFVRMRWLATLTTIFPVSLWFNRGLPLGLSLGWLLLSLLVYVDHFYGLIHGAMIGMLLRGGLRWQAGLLVITLQLGGYVAALLTGQQIVLRWSPRFDADALPALLIPLSMALVFLLWREATTYILWRITLYGLED